MSTPPCAGMYDLFDSVHPADHQRAAQLCAACPMRTGCADLLLEAQEQQVIAGAGNGPQGTWAGQLINPKRGSQ